MKLFKRIKQKENTTSSKIVKLQKKQLTQIIGGGDETLLSKEPKRTVGAGQVIEIIK